MKIWNFFRRFSWIMLLLVSIIFGLFGIGDIMQGMDADPAIAEGISGLDWEQVKDAEPQLATLIDYQVRAGGLHLFIISLISIAIILKPYRDGVQWAWYTLWALPLWTALIFVLMLLTDRPPDSPTPPPMISAPIFFAILGLTLFLDYRKFFPKDPPAAVRARQVVSDA